MPEEFHGTPETQTDESYNHPEDIEHFSHHEDIEMKEALRESKFTGVSIEETFESHEPKPKDAASPAEQPDGEPRPAAEYEEPPHPYGDFVEAQGAAQAEAAPSGPRYVRSAKPDPLDKLRNARKESGRTDEWGTGEGGYKVPKTPVERMRWVVRSLSVFSVS